MPSRDGEVTPEKSVHPFWPLMAFLEKWVKAKSVQGAFSSVRTLLFFNRPDASCFGPESTCHADAEPPDGCRPDCYASSLGASTACFCWFRKEFLLNVSRNTRCGTRISD